MPKTLGQRLAEARYRKGWSRRQLIEETGNRLSETALRNIEKGYSVPLPQTVYIICAALEEDPKSYVEDVPA